MSIVGSKGFERIPNLIKGHDEHHKIANIRFKNIAVNGKRIENAEGSGFVIDPRKQRIEFYLFHI